MTEPLKGWKAVRTTPTTGGLIAASSSLGNNSELYASSDLNSNGKLSPRGRNLRESDHHSPRRQLLNQGNSQQQNQQQQNNQQNIQQDQQQQNNQNQRSSNGLNVLKEVRSLSPQRSDTIKREPKLVAGKKNAWLMQSIFKDRQQLGPTLQNLLADFAAQNFRDEDIWNGTPEVIAQIFKYKSDWSQLKLAESNPIVAFYLSISALKNSAIKSYKVNPVLPIRQSIIQICKKLNLSEPQNICCTTLHGYVLNEDEALASYGLGTLYENWELRLVDKTLEQRKETISRLEELASYITVYYPSVSEFANVKRKSVKVKVSAYAPISRILKAICQAHKVPNPERFVLATAYEKSENFILYESDNLASYGFGTHFDNLVVRMHPKDKVTLSIITPSKYVWINFEESKLTLPMAKKVIHSVDKDNAFLHLNILESSRKWIEVNDKLLQKKTEMSRLKEENTKLKEDYQVKIEENDNFQYEYENARSEYASLHSTYQKLELKHKTIMQQNDDALMDYKVLQDQNNDLQKENEELYLVNGKLQHQIVGLEYGLIQAQKTDSRKTRSSEANPGVETELRKQIEIEKQKVIEMAKKELQKMKGFMDLQFTKLVQDKENSSKELEEIRSQNAALKMQLFEENCTREKLKLGYKQELNDLKLKFSLGENLSAKEVTGTIPKDSVLNEIRKRSDTVMRDSQAEIARLQSESKEKIEALTTRNTKLESQVSELETRNQEYIRQTSGSKLEVQSLEEKLKSLLLELDVKNKQLEEKIAELELNVQQDGQLKVRQSEQEVRASELQNKLARTRQKYRDRLESVQNQLRKAGDEKIGLNEKISKLELTIKDLSASICQKDGPGYQEDENINKILQNKVAVPQLIVLMNTMARQTNTNLRTFLLSNKGDSTPKPKLQERKVKSPAAPAAPQKNIQLAKTVEGSGPLSIDYLESAKKNLKTAPKEKLVREDDLSGLFASKLAERFKNIVARDVEDLDDSSTVDIDDDDW